MSNRTLLRSQGAASSAPTALDTRARPLIGISATMLAPSGTQPPGYRQNRSYAQAVAAADGVPVLLPLLDDEAALRALYERLDGVLLPGGGDVNPVYYGETADPDCGVEGVDDLLDRVELTLARWALAEGKPLFGICGGHQALNVAAGGTLFQDIPRQVANALSHQYQGARDALAHTIDVEPDSRLAQVLGATHLGVNSLHHQAVKTLASGFRAVAYAPDGVLEGMEHTEHAFALAVQFHPEEHVPAHTPSAHLFAAFVAACQG